MIENLLLVSIFIAPFLAAAAGLFCGNARCVRLTKALAVVASSWVAVGSVWLGAIASGPVHPSFNWISLGSHKIGLGLLYTPLAAQMMLVVGIVGTAVVLFSLWYMHSDKAQGRYFSGVSLFIGAMLGIALADNLVAVFIFWELVGFCSFLLIGHDSDQAAADGSRKAFLVNKLGDVLMLLGIVAGIILTGGISLNGPAGITGWQGGMVALLILGGVLAKSAQLPFHIWLPDAMVGPTPVSALIHAATMVAAGVYLLCRFSFIFVPVQGLILCLGLATSVLGAVVAFGQSDIKKVLAYSTISQLGFMMVGFGLGSPTAAFFHLTTHAFFKALLFLAAGSVILGAGHEQNMWKLGGLWKRQPLTAGLFAIGALSLAGFPMLAGFFSKDTIMALAWAHSAWVWGGLMFISLLSALYLGRAFGLTFMGSPRSEAAQQATEATPVAIFAMDVLGIFAIGGGLWWLYPQFGAQVFSGLGRMELGMEMIVWGALVCFLGVALAVYYSRRERESLEELLPKGYEQLREGLGFDGVYYEFGRWVLKPLAHFAEYLDDVFVRGALVRVPTSSAFLGGVFMRETLKGLITWLLYAVVLGGILWVWLFNR